jgi:hypothetical protein
MRHAFYPVAQAGVMPAMRLDAQGLARFTMSCLQTGETWQCNCSGHASETPRSNSLWASNFNTSAAMEASLNNEAFIAEQIQWRMRLTPATHASLAPPAYLPSASHDYLVLMTLTACKGSQACGTHPEEPSESGQGSAHGGNLGAGIQSHAHVWMEYQVQAGHEPGQGRWVMLGYPQFH